MLLTTLVLASGCHKGPQDGVVATVNGKPILQTDVDKIYSAQLANNPQQQSPAADQADSLKLNILHELIVEEIVEQRAAKQNLTATDADVSNYYNAHKSEFDLIEAQFHLAQIQVTDQGAEQPGNLQNNKASNDDEARKKIQALKNRIDAGEDFGALAMNFSERQDTAPNGGDMGFVSESQLKQLGDNTTYSAIEKLKAGETTDILPLLDANTHKPVGYSIYKLISRDAAGQRDLGDPRVQQAIRQQLHDSRSQLLKSAYFEMLRDQAKIQNFLAEQIFKNDSK